MKYTEREILQALNIIKDTCKEHECNYKCPFHDCHGCVINDDSPNSWDIVEYRDDFKAFK